jgi:integrase
MRAVTEHVARDGTRTYKVRYRKGGEETSETFRRRVDAQEFSAVLSAGGVVAALIWLKARKEADETYTFGEWLEVYVDQLTGVTPRTRADYRSMNARYLADLQTLPLPLIARGHITALVNRMEDDGLSAKTIKNVVHMLSSAMRLAIDEGHVTKNPCARVRLPKPGLDVVEARFLTHEEFGALYAAVPAYYQPLVAFLVGTGMRWSEATAVQARHVNLERGTVRVEQAWKWQGKGKGFVIGPPKSPKARRTVNAAVGALAAVTPLLGKPSDFVFTTPTGKPVRHNNFFGRVWQPAVKAAGFPEDRLPRIHDLRHTHASWLISDGIPLEAVQDQLGHESILTTRGTYGHLLPALGVALGRSASEGLARALGVDDGAQLGLPHGGLGRRAVEAVREPDEVLGALGERADRPGRGDR